MSNYHQIKCSDCGDVADNPRLNWSEKAVAAVIRERSWLESLASLSDWSGVEYYAKCHGESVDMPWFLRHKGHHLHVVCEYGDPCPHVRQETPLGSWDANGAPVEGE